VEEEEGAALMPGTMIGELEAEREADPEAERRSLMIGSSEADGATATSFTRVGVIGGWAEPCEGLEALNIGCDHRSGAETCTISTLKERLDCT